LTAITPLLVTVAGPEALGDVTAGPNSLIGELSSSLLASLALQKERIPSELALGGDLPIKNLEVRSGLRQDVHQTTPATVAELHLALREGEQGVVLADSHVVTRVELGAALTNDDGTRLHECPVESLHAQSLGVRVATIAS